MSSLEEELAKLDKNFAEVYRLRSKAYEKDGDIESAIDELLLAIDFYSKDPELYYKTGKLYLQLNLHSEALSSFQEALLYSKDMLKEKKAFLLVHIGRVKIKLGRYEEALKDLEEATGIISYSAYLTLYFLQAVAYYKLENFRQALLKINQFLSFTGDAKAYALRALIHHELGYSDWLFDLTKAEQLNLNYEIELRRELEVHHV